MVRRGVLCHLQGLHQADGRGVQPQAEPRHRHRRADPPHAGAPGPRGEKSLKPSRRDAARLERLRPLPDQRKEQGRKVIMANLNGFNANNVDPATDFEPIPAGKYLAVITESEMKPTKRDRKSTRLNSSHGY